MTIAYVAWAHSAQRAARGGLRVPPALAPSTVRENASATEPAKLLAIFVAETNDRNLVTFDKK